jgi:predicted lipoprotein with Yx(FWY)xxD motif
LSLFSRASTAAPSPHANSRSLRHKAANARAKRSLVPRSAWRSGPRPRPRDGLVPVLVVGLMIAALASPAGASTGPSAPTGTVVAAMSTSAYGSVLIVGKAGAVRLAGYPLYENSADSVGKFGCATKLTSALDIYQGYVLPMSCTGPGSDMANAVASDDWPALTTTGAPVAGPGVNSRLLGSVYRPGIGRQVTYAGRPLYVFHADAPFAEFLGEGVLETVLPMPPWHALWDLVSTAGLPAPGTATIETEALPDGKKVLAVVEFPTSIAAEVTVYAFSRDHPGNSACTGVCARTWIPVLTTGTPHAALGVAAKDLGVIRRPEGTDQVTYKGRPLYLYSLEKFVLPPPVSVPQATGTVGNGNGLPGPSGGTFSIVDFS